MLKQKQIDALVALAKQARDQAYAPYSGYKVGATVLTDDERVFFGCNVENASYGLALCAERAAITTAIANGAKRVVAVVVVTASDPPGTPCGACRQWMAEFGNDQMEVIIANTNGRVKKYTLGELLPDAFRL